MSDANFEVENEIIHKLLKDIGAILNRAMPPNYGFMLMLFSYGEGGDLFYMSSAQREDIRKVMLEFMKKMEQYPTVRPESESGRIN